MLLFVPLFPYLRGHWRPAGTFHFAVGWLKVNWRSFLLFLPWLGTLIFLVRTCSCGVSGWMSPPAWPCTCMLYNEQRSVQVLLGFFSLPPCSRARSLMQHPLLSNVTASTWQRYVVNHFFFALNVLCPVHGVTGICLVGLCLIDLAAHCICLVGWRAHLFHGLHACNFF